MRTTGSRPTAILGPRPRVQAVIALARGIAAAPYLLIVPAVASWAAESFSVAWWMAVALFQPSGGPGVGGLLGGRVTWRETGRSRGSCRGTG